MADTGLTSVLFLAVTVGIDHALEKKGIMRLLYGKKFREELFLSLHSCRPGCTLVSQILLPCGKGLLNSDAK